MAVDSHREFKNRLYAQFARIGKALSSPNRLEIIELLAQGERTVDSLATELGLSLANTSQHLQALRQSALVERRKQELTKDKEYVAYCRGPYCVYADRAVELLRAKGRCARRMRDGFPEWRAAGLPVISGLQPGGLRSS
jgi:DNA-binding transcriptional ArsR family regulator